MLLLTSINDRLQVVTSAAVTIDVHASWVDTAAGTITPGRTNTAISLAATTSVAGAPAASTQRNVKTLHVRNKHASASCDVTIQHTDGTIVAQLYKATLDAGQMLMYTDQAGFGGGRVSPAAGSTGPVLKVFTASGTYTPTVGMLSCIVECIGGGGAGGGCTCTPGLIIGAPGGGSGGYSRKLVSAAAIGASQVVTIGTAGTPGAAGNNPGGNGGDTSVGTLCIAKGGIGGGGGATGVGGQGGAAGTGDVVAAGAPGMAGAYIDNTKGVGSGLGGSSTFGGGGFPLNTSVVGAGSGTNGRAAANYGSGGSGAFTNDVSASNSGGAGSAGIVMITEFFS